MLLSIMFTILQQEGDEGAEDSELSDEYNPSDASSEASGGDEEADSDEDYTSLSEGDSSGGCGQQAESEKRFYV